MNRVVLTGRLTRDPEMRSLASGKTVTTFTVASNEFLGGGKEKAEYHAVVTWDRLAEIAGRYLGKGQQVAIEGRLQTRSWDDEKGARHWKTEIVASHVEMLSGRRKKDYEAQQAADSLADQAVALGEAAATEPIAEAAFDPGASDDDEEIELDEPNDGRRSGRLIFGIPPGGGATPSAPSPPCLERADELEERHGEDRVDEHQQRALEPVGLAVDRDERADADGSRDRGDLQRREDQGHRLVDHEAEQDKDRGHEQGDLEARAERHGQRELHLVLGRELDGNEVLSEVADRRDDDDADEEGRQPERRDERLDRR